MAEQHTSAIIFDFDGTIADTFGLAIKIAKTGLVNFGYEPLLDEDVVVLRELSVPQIVRKFHIKPFHLPKMINYARHELKSHYKEVIPIKDMVPIIDELSEVATVGIVSSNDEQLIRKFLRDYGLKKEIDFVRGNVGIFEKRRVIRKVMKEYKLNTATTLYVGDELRDIDAAKKAGIKSVSVTWGFNGKKVLQKAGPDYIASTTKQLRSVLLKATASVTE